MSHNPSWLDEGLPHIWLPYAQMQTSPKPLPVAHTHGSTITLANGTGILDGVSSWWSNCHGYNHPHIAKAMHAQLDAFPHVMFAGLAHEPAYTLAKKLAHIAPTGLTRSFFSDSGSTAVEVAMKMAVQHWKNKGQSKRNKFISFVNGYHGDTMGGMSLADPDGWVHKAFNHFMPKQFTMPIPSGEYGFADFRELLEGIHHTVAGMIIEPLVQGAGGFKFHSPDVLAELSNIAKEYGMLFIADEVMTGFGRTGYMFACNEAGITPDIMCLGKALTGGSIGLAVTMATEDVFEAFLSDSMDTAFLHGPTFMANPLACAAAVASLELFEAEPRLKQVAAIEMALEAGLAPARSMAHVVDVRIKGAIGVIELDNPGWNHMFALRTQALEKGCWLRPFANVLYIMPAFTISESELQKLIDVTLELVATPFTPQA